MSRNSEDAIKGAFDYYDANGNGKISSYEIKKVMDHLGLVIPENKLLAIMAQFDFNSDGEWQWPEFKEFYNRIVVSYEKYMTLDEEILGVFKLLDSDRSGRIENADIRTHMARIGKTANPAQIQQLIDAYDSNNSGAMEFDEFARFYKDAKSLE